MLKISELTVLDLNDRKIQLTSLFAERQVMLAFLRHFG